MKGIFKTTVSSVSRLFGRDEEEASAPEAPPPKPARKRPAAKAVRKPRIDAEATMSQMEQIIDRMVAKHGSAVAGRVQLLRFDDILNSVGPKRGQRLSNAIEGIVRKYVGAGDVLRTMGEGIFVVIFGGVSKEEAEAKCALIRDDVNQFVEGDPNLRGRMEVATAVAELDGSVKLQTLEDFDAVFERLDSDGGDEAPAPAPEPEPTGDPPPADTSDADAVSATQFSDWDDWLDPEKTPNVPRMPDGTPDRSGYDDPNWRDIVYEGEGSGSTAVPEGESVDIEALRRDLVLSKVVARPVWDVNRKTLVGLSSIPIQTQSNSVLTDAAVGKNPDGVMTLSLDRLAVTWAKEELSAQKPQLVIVPLHFASLASMRNRSLLFTAFLEFKPEWRTRTLGEVTFPEDIHLVAVEDVVRLLAPFVGQIGVSCGLKWRYFANLRAWGVHWAGFSIDDPNADEAEVMDDMANFAAGATEAGLVPYAKALPTRNLVMAAAAVGIRNVFAAPRPDPGGEPWQFRMEDMYPG